MELALAEERESAEVKQGLGFCHEGFLIRILWFPLLISAVSVETKSESWTGLRHVVVQPLVGDSLM